MLPLDPKHYRFERQLNWNDAIENHSDTGFAVRYPLIACALLGLLLLVY